MFTLFWQSYLTNESKIMKKLLYSLTTSIAILGLNTIPSQALESNLNHHLSNQVTSNQNQLKAATNLNSTYKRCWFVASGIEVCL